VFQVVQHCEQPLLTDYVQQAFNSPSEQECHEPSEAYPCTLLDGSD